MLSSLTGSKLDTEVPCAGVLVDYERWKMRFRESSKLSKKLPKPDRRKCRGVCPRLILKVSGEIEVDDSLCASISAGTHSLSLVPNPSEPLPCSGKGKSPETKRNCIVFQLYVKAVVKADIYFENPS